MKRPASVVILCGALILSVSMGVRQSFGLFLAPMTFDLGIGREAFAFALAVQNLLWGLFQPLTGMIADRFGAGRVVVFGAAVYALGLIHMSGAATIAELNFGAGLLVGLGTAATGFAVVLGAVGRLVPPGRRSLALGVASAGGSFGQFVVAPAGQALITAQGWPGALVTLAVVAALIAPLALALAGRPGGQSEGEAPALTLAQAIREATGHGGYRYLTLGFFVCGFQVAFIAVHLPAYLGDIGLTGETAALALALIGFFNIVGTFACGALGGIYSKKYLLSLLYLLRALVIAVFLMAPKTETTVLVFAAAIGFLWLGTVPLTSGLVGQIFGVRYLSTLFGIVFFSHQMGSFLGVWLGGYAFDALGSYDPVWMGSIALGLGAALLHLPINEKPLRASA
ncbi:MAG: MFS transporter [Rhodospirillales bacterium]|nr:MFS transporter [Rhodospirillales bacterium]